MTETPRIWIGSLAAYNAGRLLGEWFDAIDAPTSPREWVDALIESGSAPEGWLTADEIQRNLLAEIHEEIWVFDHENFGPWLKGECAPATAQRIAEVIEELGDRADAAGVFLTEVQGEHYVTDWDQFLEDFEGAYVGEYDSAKDFAYEFVDEFLEVQEVKLPKLFGEWGGLSSYLDMDAIVRDMRHAGYNFENSPSGGVFVFAQ